MDATERATGKEKGAGIEIGDDCWLGGGVIVCPGVKIGCRCVIGAGSVVTHDIPDNSVAAGNPARVIRTATDRINPPLRKIALGIRNSFRHNPLSAYKKLLSEIYLFAFFHNFACW